MSISTRRFFARPSAVVFGATGCDSPRPCATIMERGTPWPARLTGQKIVVKGFTDNVPIGPKLRSRFPTNEALSLVRAQDVVDYLSSMSP